MIRMSFINLFQCILDVIYKRSINLTSIKRWQLGVFIMLFCVIFCLLTVTPLNLEAFHFIKTFPKYYSKLPNLGTVSSVYKNHIRKHTNDQNRLLGATANENFRPSEQSSDLQALPLQFPPWVVPLREEPYEDHEEMTYGYETYMDHFRKLNEEKRTELAVYQPYITPTSSTRHNTTYGFKVKQLQPVGYHNGRAYTYFYMHSHHMDIPPVLLNALRRSSLSFLRGGAVTALHIPGMHHEFYSIAGVRELYFEIIQNLRQITLRGVPENATFSTPIIGSFRIKGPMVVVAGHMQFTQFPSNYDANATSTAFRQHYPSPHVPDSSPLSHQFQQQQAGTAFVTTKTGENPSVKPMRVQPSLPSIINPNQYICSVAAGHYLSMDVKIENIDSEGVMPEWGFESSGRDIDSKGFIHFPATISPIETFAIRAQRRGLSVDLLGEIVTVEIHTDGTRSPRRALLESTDAVFKELLQMQWALYNNCHVGEDGSMQDEFQDEDVYLDKDRYTNVPWNPYKTKEQQRKEALEFLQQEDVVRQYAIDPTSKKAKEELQREWEAKKSRLKQRGATTSAELAPEDVFPPDQSKRTIEPSRWVLENPFNNISPADLEYLRRQHSNKNMNHNPNEHMNNIKAEENL